MAKRMVITLSQKGGVGKTAWLCSLIQALRHKGVACEAYDADGANSSLSRTLGQTDPNPATGCRKYDLSSPAERNLLVVSARDAADGSVICHDLGGGALADLRVVGGDDGKRQSASGFLNCLEECNTLLTVVHLMSPFKETQASAAAICKEIPQGRADHLFVLPEWYETGTLKDFPFWGGYDSETGRVGGKLREKMLGAGAREIFFPKLRPVILAKLSAESVAIPVGKTLKELNLGKEIHGLGSLDFGEIGSLATWSEHFLGEIEQAADLLGYPATTTPDLEDEI